MYLLGIDVGTSGVKALLISDKGEFTAESLHTYPLLSPNPGWFEQNPDDWWDAAVKSIRDILAKAAVEPGQIAGIGLSGQYHGSVLLGKDNGILRPAILWNDQRTQLQSDRIIERAGSENLLRLACTGGAPYFTACKLEWVRDNEPDVYERVCKLILPKDYVRFKLTGVIATDVSDASGTLFLDVPNRCWSEELVGLIGAKKTILPGLFESPVVSGTVTPEAARATGLPSGIPVAGGAGDQASAAIGNGIVDEGIVTYSIGTSGVIYAATDSPRSDPGGRANTFCHAVPGRWCLLACINAAAGSLQWFQEKLADAERAEAEQTGRNVYELLMDMAASVSPGSDRLLFVPYLSGERHPHTDTNARGVFFGLHMGHGRDHMLRAVLEGVAYAFKDCLEVMRELGVSIHEIRATGGGAKSDLWLGIQANVSNEPIYTMAADEGGAAYGAALLGGVCASVFGSVREACDKLVRTARSLKPDRDKVDIYDRLFRFYRTLYPLFRESYKDLQSL